MAASPPLTSPCSWAELFSECHNVWYRVVYHLSDRKKSCCAAHMARWQTWQMKHFVCFCLSTGFFPNTSLLSEQKGPAIFDVVCERERVREGAERGGGGSVIQWYTAPVLCHTAQCLLGNNLTSCARHIQAMSREGARGGRKEKKKGEWGMEGEEIEGRESDGTKRWGRGERERGERAHNQFSGPVSIMSSPVSIDLRIKLLRDHPELLSDRCSGKRWPGCRRHAQNTSDPSPTTGDPCSESVVGRGALFKGHIHMQWGTRKTGSAYGQDH